MSSLFDIELIQKYDRPGPRYTSYPTAPHLVEGFGEDAFRAALAADPGCMGQVAHAVLDKNGLARRVARNVVARPRGHARTVASVDGTRVDAALVWLWALREAGRGRVQAVPIPPGQNVVEPLEAQRLNTGRHAAAARRFIVYLRGPTARAILAREGLLARQ